MNIRKKLTLQFITIVALIMTFATLAIYFFSSNYRKEDFYQRLHSKSNITAKLLLEVEEIGASLLVRIEKDNPVSLPRERIIIYNYKNEILYTSDKEKVLDIPVTLLNEIRLKQKIEYKQGEYEILGYLFKDRFERFVVIVGAVDIYGWKKVNNLQTVLLIVFAMSILLTLISGWVYAGRALKPITVVIQQVNEISIRSLNLRVDEGNGTDEIALLAHTFNEMLARLERSFKIQENFIANASHELRTPLTAISGQLEVVLMKDRSVDEYKAVIDSVREDIKNLILISNRLLLLAQASGEKPLSDVKPLRIDEIVWQAISELQKRKPEYVITLNISPDIEDESSLMVTGNDQLLKTAIINLMENGCKFSNDHTVYVTIGKEDQDIPIEFRDYGIGILSEDLPHILEPFHRGKNAISVKGHGIGLSLVDLIVKLHHGRLSFISLENKGSSFTIHLPAGRPA